MHRTRTSNYRENLLEVRKKSLRQFADVAHRFELVDTINGVDWINDSKATDPQATCHSLELVQKPVIWIVGTCDYPVDYHLVERLTQYKVKSLISFGIANDDQIVDRLKPLVDHYHEVHSLSSAVHEAKMHCKQGDIVLLSPAVPSYDMFQDFRDRGEQFRKLVYDLKQ